MRETKTFLVICVNVVPYRLSNDVYINEWIDRYLPSTRETGKRGIKREGGKILFLPIIVGLH